MAWLVPVLSLGKKADRRPKRTMRARTSNGVWIMTDNVGGTMQHAVRADSADSQALAQSVPRLCAEFAGLYDTGTVERMLASSYEQLAALAPLSNTTPALPVPALPALAERYARERLFALAKTDRRIVTSGPAVLFLCSHKAGRSQMALGFFKHLVRDRAPAWSGGSAQDAVVNRLVVQAMTERGVEISAEFPKPWTDELMWAADVVIDMGCGDDGPILSGHRYEQWPLPDPADHDIDQVRAIRDDIELRVRRLVTDLGLAAGEPDAPKHDRMRQAGDRGCSVTREI